MWFEFTLTPLAEEIAGRIAGPSTNAEALGRARRIAEAQVDLNRVRDCRRRLVSGWLANSNYELIRVLKQKTRLAKAIDRAERRPGQT